ncbi:GNAT family N-acetyltransferase [Micromonospora sp. WP24]|nr:GNAT family N-acetyltransferase [Micromonospora sp. WP24]
MERGSDRHSCRHRGRPHVEKQESARTPRVPHAAWRESPSLRAKRSSRLATVTIITPFLDDDPRAWQCLRRYATELAERFPEGYDEATLTRPEELDGALLLACERDRPAGCGVWVRLSPGIAEIRHLWTDTTARGLGLGRRLLDQLETDAAAHGVRTLRLGTHSSLDEAIALYRSSGYREIDPYNTSPYNQLCFEKRL